MPKTRPRSSNPPRPLNLNPHREEKHSKTGSEGYRGNEFIGCTLISLFKYHWWLVACIKYPHRPSSSKHFFFLLFLFLFFFSPRRLFLPTSRKFPDPTYPQDTSYISLYFCQEDSCSVNYNEGHEIRDSEALSRHGYRHFCQLSREREPIFRFVRRIERKEGKVKLEMNLNEREIERERVVFLGSCRIFFRFFSLWISFVSNQSLEWIK